MPSQIPIAAVVPVALIVWAAIHVGFAMFFRFVIVGRSISSCDDAACYTPKASVLLSLRGQDPCLQQTLTNLLTQSYPDFEVIVIIDNERDPSWQVVQQAKDNTDTDNRLRFFALKNPLPTCSLKCSALVQATEHLSSDSEVVVLVDADVVPHANWLLDAVGPLNNPRIGVITGNQWFEPKDRDTGSLLRSLWNAGALVSTALNANPWAGTCAMRVSDLQESGLTEDWKTSLVDDGPIKKAFDRIGLQVRFEPKLIMVNHDRCDMAFVNRYVTRMLTWSRIYEATFVATVIHAFIMGAMVVSPWLLLGSAVAIFDASTMLVLALSIVLTNTLFFVGYICVRASVTQAVEIRGDAVDRMATGTVCRILILLPLCQLAHVLWTLKAVFIRRVVWRGITYRIGRGRQVVMDDYRPYTTTQGMNRSQASV